MTQNRPAVNGRQQPIEDADRMLPDADRMLPDADRMLPDLARVHRHAVELLAQLARPPRSLRIAAGAATIDITWADEAAVDTGPGAPSTDRAEPDQAAADAEEYLTSPGVGVFYHAREPGAEPFVAVGSPVQPGQQIGIIEAMKLMIPIEADRAGRISLALKANGEPVEYGEPLFALEPGSSDADV